MRGVIKHYSFLQNDRLLNAAIIITIYFVIFKHTWMDEIAL